ncbi:prenyltransferase [Halomonas alimentaria]|uniref:Prenyltransferase n=1 Tax=Halomonas alimentaria TaxID=147248 RepID=A0A7X4W519_9GAMM|nr:prenyltransferase [Halomonas alimentaria]NAW33601.1 prenyltransferase [Halomonas alimentaria]
MEGGTTTPAVWRASRPGFLVLAPLCVVLGLLLAVRQGVAPAALQVALVLLGGLLAHAAVNLLNEYEDFRSGLDEMTLRTPFSGGSGALPEAPVAAPAVLAAGLAALAGVVAIGGYFLWARGWPMLAVGVPGLALIVAYTRWITRSPWLCLLAPGLGFGPLVILGSLVALGGWPDATALIVAAVAGLLVSELLLLNQFPDCEADRRVGRRHLPILLGRQRAARLVVVLLLGSQALVGIGVLLGGLPVAAGLTWLVLPGALWVAWRLPAVLEQRARLEALMGLNVVVLLATLALLAAGFWLG